MKWKQSKFKSTKQKVFKSKIYGFDIETANNNKDFVCCSIYSDKVQKTFWNKEDFINEIKKKPYWNSYIIATNLAFDFFGVFFNNVYAQQFNTLFRGSDLLSAKTYVEAGEFTTNPVHRNGKIIFIDSMNYAKMSVERMGKIIGVSKYEKPSFLGQHPKDEEEKLILQEYNMKDSEITYKFMDYLFKGFQELGADVKQTIASTSMSLFKNKYLDMEVFPEKKDILLEIFKSYYGGRTESFIRGFIEDANYYDINCFSSDTEILTTKGFKKYEELSNDDVVYGMKNNKLEEQKINKIILNKYKGQMINFTNENTDMLVTPNHRVYFKCYQRNKKPYYWNKFEVREARNVPLSYVKLPNAYELIKKEYNIKDEMIKLLCWYVTEGSKKYNVVEISQSWDHNPNNCIEILEILKKLKINYKIKNRVQKGKNYLYVKFKWDEISKYFINNNMNSYNIRLPYIYKDLSVRQKLIMFNTLIKGDGNIQKGKTTYVSYSKELLNDFQILCTLIGKKCSINKTVAYIKNNRNGESTLKNINIIEYDGHVWCVSVPLENVVVRRNNKVFISGNSLYPSVMHDEVYPDPNSLRIAHYNSTDKILHFEGVSHVDLEVHNKQHPLLPYKTAKGKLIFPVGEFSGYYTHIELRKALNEGYKIKKVHVSYYYTKTCRPFKAFVDDLYKKRMKYKKDDNEMELIVKLLLNSLYGKFAQKFMGKENYIPKNIVKPEDLKGRIEFVGDYIRVEKDCEPSSFCIPIWASYVTGYARLKLYDIIQKVTPIYCDTDSIITQDTLDTSKDLGMLKLEMKVKYGVIVRPKFYMLIDNDDNNIIKIKGLGKSVNMQEFYDILKGNDPHYYKFLKPKEAIRRRLIPNEILEVSKHFNVNDEKRSWISNFDPTIAEYSQPLKVLANGDIINTLKGTVIDHTKERLEDLKCQHTE